MSVLHEWHRSLEPMREFKELHERLDPMRGIKEAHWGLASVRQVGERERSLDTMREVNKLDRMLDPMRKLREQQERMDRMLDPMRGLMEHQRAMDRMLGAMGGFGEAHERWARTTKLETAGLADFALPRKASRSVSLTIIKSAPRVQARCQVCKRPVQIGLKPDGIWEVFSLCDCGALALAVARDVADAARRNRCPTLTVIAGDRSPETGPGLPIGRLRLVRPDEPEFKDQ